LFVIYTITLFSAFCQQNAIPQFPEWMVKKRLESLNKKTPIQMDYNERVQAYINVYTVNRRDHLAKIISRSKLYFPLFEEYLDKYDLPLELKYLAVIESALDPTAKSKSGARGLWQFLYHAGTMFELEVSTYTDERCDPVLATDAACQYLEYLYRIFNDWQLALAAYNGGAGAVKKAIARSGGIKNYWELSPYLPEQVKGYVPAFIAAAYAMNYYSSYAIKEIPPKYQFNDLDTVFIHKSLTFKRISDVIGISIEELTFINPIFTKETIPVDDKPVSIFLPNKFIDIFVQNEMDLYQSSDAESPFSARTHQEKIYHAVQKGEYLHKIAIQYGCTVDNIIKWNKLSSQDLHPGQKIIIWQKQESNPYFFIKSEVKNITEL
jgi:membrane-bound lytic murein transglycosylase D